MKFAIIPIANDRPPILGASNSSSSSHVKSCSFLIKNSFQPKLVGHLVRCKGVQTKFNFCPITSEDFKPLIQQIGPTFRWSNPKKSYLMKYALIYKQRKIISCHSSTKMRKKLSGFWVSITEVDTKSKGLCTTPWFPWSFLLLPFFMLLSANYDCASGSKACQATSNKNESTQESSEGKVALNPNCSTLISQRPGSAAMINGFKYFLCADWRWYV